MYKLMDFLTFGLLAIGFAIVTIIFWVMGVDDNAVPLMMVITLMAIAANIYVYFARKEDKDDEQGR